ncbi:hypothetical protein P5V15_002620 [Pogonomyrmex californicus]
MQKQKETSGPKRGANECRQCGAKGHFRTECPSLVNSGKGNLGSPSFVMQGSARKCNTAGEKNFSFRNLSGKSGNFCFQGRLDDQNCVFKIDTGSDVSILNKRLIRSGRQQFWVGKRKLRYPTGQEVPIDFKTNVKVELGKFSLEFPMYVAEIEDECILGADFLVKILLE